MNTVQDIIYCRLRTASPLHIGGNEVFEPTAFVIDEKEMQLISFDSADFINRLNEESRQEFSAICKKGTPQSLVEIYRFMDRHKDLATGNAVAVSNAFLEHYKKTLRLQGDANVLQNLNKYQIKRTAFNPLDDTPFIPGSAIKGSIRTAILNLRNQGKSIPPYGQYASSDLEKDLIGGSFASDPFSLVKVSDFMPVGEVKRRIVYGVNRKKKLSKFSAKGPEQIFEVIDPGAEFFGFINISAVVPGAKINKPISKKEIFTALQNFFGGVNERENGQLRNVDIPRLSISTGDQQYPIRLGYHSGAESVTVGGRRKIRIMKGGKAKPKTEYHATTFWLAGSAKDSPNPELKPMGWATLDELPTAETVEIQAKMQEERQKRKTQQQQLYAKRQQEAKLLKEQLLQQQEEDAKRKAAAEEEAKASEQRLQQWQALSEEEQDIACIRNDATAHEFAPQTAGDPLPHIWPKVAKAKPEHQKTLAEAFKERWEKEGKWAVKKKKKKQFEKVQTVKKILGLI